MVYIYYYIYVVYDYTSGVRVAHTEWMYDADLHTPPPTGLLPNYTHTRARAHTHTRTHTCTHTHTHTHTCTHTLTHTQTHTHTHAHTQTPCQLWSPRPPLGYWSPSRRTMMAHRAITVCCLRVGFVACCAVLVWNLVVSSVVLRVSLATHGGWWLTL